MEHSVALKIGRQPKNCGRLQSLDVLRGFDMFWIIGGDVIFREFINWSHCSWLETNIAPQLHHASWHGFRAYDLIFPLFIFIAGVTLPFVFEKLKLKNVVKGKISSKILKRALFLVILGMVYNGMLQFNFSDLRIPSVLGLIGLSYGLGALIVLHFSVIRQITIGLMFLVGYYGLMCFIPGTDLSSGGNVASYVDRFLLSGHLYRNNFDPEGILFMIPASVLVIMGALAGHFLKESKKSEYKKCGLLALIGVVFITGAIIWSDFFPINKQLWSSSFILLTGGIAGLLLSFFYLIVDVWNIKKLFYPFILIGSNSILIYFLAHKFIDFKYTSKFLFGGTVNLLPNSLLALGMSIAVLITELILLWFLYRKKIFLKV